jgi:hypothetical protein
MSETDQKIDRRLIWLAARAIKTTGKATPTTVQWMLVQIKREPRKYPKDQALLTLCIKALFIANAALCRRSSVSIDSQ